MLKNTEAPKTVAALRKQQFAEIERTGRVAAYVIPNPTLAERRAQVMAEYLRTGRI